MTGEDITVTHPDRVVFPDVGITKGEVVAYYAAVGETMLPYLEGRALTIERYPKGTAEEGFMQKNAPDHYPDYIERFEVPKEEGGVTLYPVIHDADAIVYLANQGVITFHIPPTRVPDLDKPDWVIWDLDPSESGVEKVRKGAHALRKILDDIGVETSVMTSGSRGYHLRAMIEIGPSSDDVAGFARGVAVLAAEADPDLFTVEFMKKKRGERVFIDWLRNAPLATAVAPWSLRPRKNAPVASPLTWDEVDQIAPDAIDLEGAVARLDENPWRGMKPVDVSDAIHAVEETLEKAGIELPPFDRFRS
ncbi:MAG TPA: non-homologous end-joining DNA ligase [Acidimicrobiia bacterium]